MKTLTTLTAVAALVAGMSFASAQSTMKPDQAKVDGTAAYCLTGKDGKKACNFATLETCQKASGGNAAMCSPNAKSATTGSKQ
ncbi:MAG: DUF3551 domain-containing protein [Pseudolabrys sp.]